MAVDEELKAAVKAAKGKRSYFAFIQKSASDGTLLVGKSKIPEKDITAAKKKNGGSTTLKGAVWRRRKIRLRNGKGASGQRETRRSAQQSRQARRGNVDRLSCPQRQFARFARRQAEPRQSLRHADSGAGRHDSNQRPGAEVDNPYGTPIPVDKKGTAAPQVDKPYGTPIPVEQKAPPVPKSTSPTARRSRLLNRTKAISIIKSGSRWKGGWPKASSNGAAIRPS